MKIQNKIILEEILIGMAARIKNNGDDKYKSEMRRSDCYTYVSKSIKEYFNDPEIDNCRIVIYSLGGNLGHCVMKDKKNNIVADDFRESRTYYNKDNGDVIYNNLKFGSISMGENYKLDENSFEISVAEFKNIFVNNIDSLLELRKLRKENPQEKGDIVNSLINKNSSDSIIFKVKMSLENYLSEKKVLQVDNKTKNNNKIRH